MLPRRVHRPPQPYPRRRVRRRLERNPVAFGGATVALQQTSDLALHLLPIDRLLGMLDPAGQALESGLDARAEAGMHGLLFDLTWRGTTDQEDLGWVGVLPAQLDLDPVVHRLPLVRARHVRSKVSQHAPRGTEQRASD